jgi:hypothetical protein
MSGYNEESREDPAFGVKIDSCPGVLDEGSDAMDPSYTMDAGSAESVNVPCASGIRKLLAVGAN